MKCDNCVDSCDPLEDNTFGEIGSSGSGDIIDIYRKTGFRN